MRGWGTVGRTGYRERQPGSRRAPEERLAGGLEFQGSHNVSTVHMMTEGRPSALTEAPAATAAAEAQAPWRLQEMFSAVQPKVAVVVKRRRALDGSRFPQTMTKSARSDAASPASAGDRKPRAT